MRNTNRKSIFGRQLNAVDAILEIFETAASQ